MLFSRPSIIVLCLLLLCGCPSRTAESQGTSGTLPDAGSSTSTETTKDTSVNPETDPRLQVQKQLVIVYTGNTHARLWPAGTAKFDNLTGGLPALAAEISAVELELVSLNRAQLANEGRDTSAIRVDLDSGLIGEQPFMLLDYGGWVGADLLQYPAHTALMLEAQRELRYTAVALRDWPLFSAQELALIAGFSLLPTLVNTPGEQPREFEQLSRIVLREVYGELWGIVSLPRLPEEDRDKYRQQISELVEQCAAELELSGAQHGILLAGDQTGDVYRELKQDRRFDIVIGAPGAMSAQPGFDEMPEDGPLLLPGLANGGTELGHCHIIWEDDNPLPRHYFFERRSVRDDDSEHLPWRRRIAQLDNRP
jgi:hypothetical protein